VPSRAAHRETVVWFKIESYEKSQVPARDAAYNRFDTSHQFPVQLGILNHYPD